MSRRAKESDASLAFSKTTIDDVMMMSFFGYFLPLLCVFYWIFFCVFWWISFCFCVRKSSIIILLQCRPKQQCFITHFSRKFSLLRKKKKIRRKKRKERNKKKDKMLCSSRLPFAFFFLSPPKKKILSFFDRLCPTFLCVALRLHQRKKRGASKNDSSARLTPAPTKRTREREKHTHTYIHTHTQRERERRTWANASRKRRLRKKSSLNWTRRLRARSAITRNRSPRNSIFNSIRGWWSARCAGKNTRARSTIYRRPSTCIRIGSTRARG